MRAVSFTKFIILLIMLQSAKLFAQSPIIVNMQVLPPYSPVIADYLTFDATSVITLTNTSNVAYDLKLAVHITGDNGIEAYTNPGFVPSLPITIAPFATRTIYGSELQSYNDVGYTVIGTDAQQIAVSGIIPDGFYTLCVEAQDYFTSAPLSAPEPSGCIPLYIRYLDAPFLLAPMCNDTVNQTFPQTVIFNWVTPPGAPPTTLYHFKLIEVIPFDRNPYDAMAASTTPAFFETSTNLPLLIYGPGQPPLETGRTYAWQVTAFNAAVPTYFQNDGKSEVCSFIYKQAYVNYVSDTTGNFVTFMNNDNVNINGNLQYYYSSEPGEGGSNTDINSTTSTISYPFRSEPVRLVTKYMLKYNGGLDSIYLPFNTTGFDLAGNDVVLANATTGSNGDFSFEVPGFLFPETGLVQTGVTVNIPDANLIDHYFNVASGSSGGFDFGDIEFNSGFGHETDNGFTFSNVNDYDFNQNNYQFNSGLQFNNDINLGGSKPFDPGGTINVVNYSGGTGGNPYSGTFTGDLYKVVQVFVNNEYYCMPDNSFRNISDSSSTYVGIIKARVRDYVLDVNINTLYNEAGANNFNNNGNSGGTSTGGSNGMSVGTTKGNTYTAGVNTNTNTGDIKNNTGIGAQNTNFYNTTNNNRTGSTPEFDLGGDYTNQTYEVKPEYFYYSTDDNDLGFTTQLPWDFELNDNSSDLLQLEGVLYRYSIYRETFPDNLPSHEGMNLGNDNTAVMYEDGSVFNPDLVSGLGQVGVKDYGAGRTLISRLESKTGSVSFNKLIKSIDQDDYYILVIEPIDDNTINPAVEIKFRFDHNNFNQVDKAIYSSQYNTLEVDLDATENSVLSSSAVVTGKINFKYDDPEVPQSFPLKNVNVTLQRLQYVITDEGAKVYSRTRTDLITVETDAQGKYLFNYTDTAAYGFIAMEGMIFGEDNCSLDIPDEVNPDIPGMDEMNPGIFQQQQFKNQLNRISPMEDDFEIYMPTAYGKSAPKPILLFGAPMPDAVPSPCPYSGKLYQELGIKVESSYYTSPATHFTILPAQYKEVPDLLCYVKSYDLTLTVKADPDIAVQYKTPNSALRDMLVVLVRKSKPADVPENEGIVGGLDNAAVAKLISNAEKLFDFTGTAMHINIDNDYGGGALGGLGYYNPYGDVFLMDGITINESEIIGCGLVDVNGKITFKNLVKNVGTSDNYYLVAIPDYSNSDINYLVPQHVFKTGFTTYTTTNPYGPYTITTTESTAREGVYPKMKVNYTMEAIPQNPIIFGKVLRSDNGYPLLDADVKLLDNPGSVVEMQTKTASDGTYFLTLTKEQYNSSSISLFTRQLKFSKYGYDDTYSSYPLYLKKGKILNRVADTLQPAVLVTGYIYTEWWNENENRYPGAPSYVQIGNGPQVHTACYDDDFTLDLSAFTDYVQQQPILDITTLVPNYEEMWEQNAWDPSVQVFQNYNDVGHNENTGINLDNNVNTGFDIGNDINLGGKTFVTNRSGDVGTGISIDGDLNSGSHGTYMNAKTSGIDAIGTTGKTTFTTGKVEGTGSTGKTISGSGISGSSGIESGSTMGGTGTLGSIDNSCDLAYYATFASRGTWLAEINPDSTRYITRIENVYVPDTGNVLRVDFIVYQKLHRMRFNVEDVNGNRINAKIEIVGITDVLSTGTDGTRDIFFENSGNTFTVIVNGPDGSSYVQKELSLTNEASEFAVTYEVVLTQGASISGKVTNGTPPVANARVYIDAAGLEYIEAYTNANGEYTLNGVPKVNGFTVRAVKEGTGLIGDSHWVVTLGATTITNINFNLTNYSDLDLSKLLGFKTEIEYLSNSGGEIKISGSLVDIAENSRFSVADDVRLPFNYIKVKASTTLNGSGVPYAEPVDASFTVSNTSAIPVLVYDKYLAQAGIVSSSCIVEKVNGTSGKIKSPLRILETTFTDPGFNFIGYGSTGFYLKNKSVEGGFVAMGGSHDNIVLFTTGAATLPTGDYYEIEIPYPNSKLSFNVENVSAYINNSTTNRLYKDSLVLDTYLNPAIAYSAGFETPLHIGKLQITPTSVSSKSGTTPFTVKLEKWDLDCTSWSLNSTGFNMKTGKLDASGVVFNFNNIKIENGELVFATSSTLGKSSVTLIDLLSLNIQNFPDLIYNGANWQIYVGGNETFPAASISNIPGLPSNNNDLTLQILLFYSNADAEFKMNNNTFDLYQVTSFTTDEGALYVHEDVNTGESYLTLPGIIDLNLPSVSVQPTAFLIKNNNGSISTELEPFGFGMEVNGVTADFNAGNIEFKTNGLIVSGTVSESPYFNHSVKLYHLTDSTAINTIPNQKFQYTTDGQSINNLFGRMYPITNSWTNYQFTGDVTGAAKTSGKWTFTVYGEITAENQKVDVSDLKMTGATKSMNFDNMGLSFDYPNRRLVGSISIDESMPGGGSISGQANCVYDDEGWYFVCGGLISMPSNPYITEVSLAILFGDYPIANEQPVKSVFTEYSYDGKLPDAFASVISGFYIDGKVELPIPYVPNFEVDFVVVSAEFEATIAAGFQLGMNFTEALNTYYTGLDASVHVHAGVGASVVFGCAGVSLDAQVALGLTGQYSSNGEWFVNGAFEASLAASAYAGIGLACDSQCDGLCEMDEWGGEVGVKLSGEMGYQNGDNYTEMGIDEAYIK